MSALTSLAVVDYNYFDLEANCINPSKFSSSSSSSSSDSYFYFFFLPLPFLTTFFSSTFFSSSLVSSNFSSSFGKLTTSYYFVNPNFSVFAGKAISGIVFGPNSHNLSPKVCKIYNAIPCIPSLISLELLPKAPKPIIF